ncbi:MAG: hypothetical protein L3J57_14210 [Desulfuromusa sp.]|nr:hypothetical protein [Desulfuromusa sp.]
MSPDLFKPANDILNYAVRSIVAIIMMPGLINVDFAEVKTILSYRGRVIMGTGSASMTMDEFHEISDHIHQKVADDANVVSGFVVDEDAGDSLNGTVVASGLGANNLKLIAL